MPGLQVIVSKKASLPLQRNVGAQKAQGKWLIFVDADSVFLPYFMERVVAYLQNHDPAFFTTWCMPDSDVAGDGLITLLTNAAYESAVKIKRPFAPGPLTIVKAEVYKAVGGYDETRGFGEDSDFSQRISDHGYSFGMIRETLYQFSLRRFRKQGTLKVLQTYAKGAIQFLINGKTPKNMSGYVMGGQEYRKNNKPKEKSRLKAYEGRIKRLLEDLF